jgi:hypothetical protein
MNVENDLCRNETETLCRTRSPRAVAPEASVYVFALRRFAADPAAAFFSKRPAIRKLLYTHTRAVPHLTMRDGARVRGQT